MAESEAVPTVAETEWLLRRVAFAVRQHGRRTLDRFDITPPQFDALQFLVHDDPQRLTMGELCQKLYLASSTVTDLVQRMEAAGIVRRERDAEDRRLVRLTVLDKGKVLIQEVIAERRAYLSTVLERLSPTERSSIEAGLRRLHGIMQGTE